MTCLRQQALADLAAAAAHYASAAQTVVDAKRHHTGQAPLPELTEQHAALAWLNDLAVAHGAEKVFADNTHAVVAVLTVWWHPPRAVVLVDTCTDADGHTRVEPRRDALLELVVSGYPGGCRRNCRTCEAVVEELAAAVTPANRKPTDPAAAVLGIDNTDAARIAREAAGIAREAAATAVPDPHANIDRDASARAAQVWATYAQRPYAGGRWAAARAVSEAQDAVHGTPFADAVGDAVFRAIAGVYGEEVEP